MDSPHPAPWTAKRVERTETVLNKRYQTVCWEVCDKEGVCVCRCEDEDTASLIAAAPSLCVVCVEAADLIENLIPESVGNDDADDVLNALRAAVSKATKEPTA